jgi:DNA-binding NarL/FixJ family response regulator
MNPSTASTPIRVLVVDDHHVVRAGLRTLLSADPRICVVGEAALAAEVFPALTATRPQVVLLDVRLPDGSGTELAGRITALPNPPRVVILTSFLEPTEVFRALAANVDGYLLKDSEGDALVAALVAVAHGEQVLHPQVLRLVLGQVPESQSGGPLDRLTPQERRILGLITQGQTNKEIGGEIGVSEKTVRNLMTNVLAKLGVERRQQAVALFVRESGS